MAEDKWIKWREPHLYITIFLCLVFTTLWIFIRAEWLQTVAVGFVGVLIYSLQKHDMNMNRRHNKEPIEPLE